MAGIFFFIVHPQHERGSDADFVHAVLAPDQGNAIDKAMRSPFGYPANVKLSQAFEGHDFVRLIEAVVAGPKLLEPLQAAAALRYVCNEYQTGLDEGQRTVILAGADAIRDRFFTRALDLSLDASRVPGGTVEGQERGRESP